MLAIPPRSRCSDNYSGAISNSHSNLVDPNDTWFKPIDSELWIHRYRGDSCWENFTHVGATEAICLFTLSYAIRPRPDASCALTPELCQSGRWDPENSNCALFAPTFFHSTRSRCTWSSGDSSVSDSPGFSFMISLHRVGICSRLYELRGVAEQLGSGLTQQYLLVNEISSLGSPPLSLSPVDQQSCCSFWLQVIPALMNFTSWVIQKFVESVYAKDDNVTKFGCFWRRVSIRFQGYKI